MAWALPSWKRRVLLDQPTKLAERATDTPLFAVGPVRLRPLSASGL